MQPAQSDIYECPCGEALSFAATDDGESPDGHVDLLCLRCLRAFVVDLDDGTLRTVEEVAQTGAEMSTALDVVLADMEALTRQLTEARLTLAAEQGKAEGAPAPGWTYSDGRWSKTFPTGHEALVLAPGGNAVVYVVHPTEGRRRFAQPNMRQGIITVEEAQALAADKAAS